MSTHAVLWSSGYWKNDYSSCLCSSALQVGTNEWRINGIHLEIVAYMIEFLGTVIREVPPGTTPIQFLRELEKCLRNGIYLEIVAYMINSFSIADLQALL